MLFRTKTIAVMVDKVVYDFLTEIGATITISDEKYKSFTIYDKRYKKTYALAGFLFESLKNSNSKIRRINTKIVTNVVTITNYYDFRISNFNNVKFHSRIKPFCTANQINTDFDNSIHDNSIHENLHNTFELLPSESKALLEDIVDDIFEASNTAKISSKLGANYVLMLMDDKRKAYAKHKLLKLAELSRKVEQGKNAELEIDKLNSGFYN